MKRIKILLLIFSFVLCVVAILFVTKRLQQDEKKNRFLSRSSVARDITSNAASNNLQVVLTQPSDSSVMKGHSVSNIPVNTILLPIEVKYKPIIMENNNKNIVSILDAVSNAIFSVNQILQAKSYKVNSFGPTVWLVAEDKMNSTIWRIFPYNTNIISSIEMNVYQDVEMKIRDKQKSFRVSFYPETGTLRDFSWADDHEVLFVLTNGTSDYGRDLGGKMGLEMRWDRQGNLVSSNIYNWATRGQPIGKKQDQEQKIPSHFYPTSSVEAATESWRQKQE